MVQQAPIYYMKTFSLKCLAAMLVLAASAALAADDVIQIPNFGPSTVPSVDPAAPAAAAPVPTLKLGDPAPKLTNGKWVQGDAVTSFEPGKAYLLDFWATWCGPCVESIPHVNEISLKYKGSNLVVIGQVCWEDNGGADEEVAPFVKKMGDKMTYRVALDDTTGSAKGKMAENWMQAAGQDGIPTAFLVDTKGRLAWMGHPMELKDSVIDQVLAGTFDIQKAAADLAQQKLDDIQLDKLADELDSALSDKKWDDANAKLVEMAKLMPADETNRLDMVRFGILLGKKDYPGAYKLAAQISDDHKDDVRLLDKLAWGIAADPSIETRDLDLAEKIAKQGNETAKGQDPSTLDTLARLSFMRGKKDEAVAFEQQAIAVATDDQKDELKQSLESYKKGELPKDQ